MLPPPPTFLNASFVKQFCSCADWNGHTCVNNAAISVSSMLTSSRVPLVTASCRGLDQHSGSAMRATQLEDEGASPILVGRSPDQDVVELRTTNALDPQREERADVQSPRFDSLRRFWDRHVHMGVKHQACRDHLGQSNFQYYLHAFEGGSPTTHFKS